MKACFPPTKAIPKPRKLSPTPQNRFPRLRKCSPDAGGDFRSFENAIFSSFYPLGYILYRQPYKCSSSKSGQHLP